MKNIIRIILFLILICNIYSIPPGTTIYIYSPLGREIEAEAWGRRYLKEIECHRYNLIEFPSAKYIYNESGTDCIENYACYGYS